MPVPELDPNDPDFVPAAMLPVAVRAANEGVPVCAIARILGVPSGNVYRTLQEQIMLGHVAGLPQGDWPPDQRAAARSQQFGKYGNLDDLMFACAQRFRMSRLEAAMLVALLSKDRLDKTRLHHVIETQRASRATQPAKLEATDPKMVDVMICKMRKKLKQVDSRVLITTSWGHGYHIDRPVKAIIMQLLEGDASAETPQQEVPLNTPTPTN